VIESLPPGSWVVLVVKEAVPPTSVAFPRLAVPFKNVTVPPGVPAPAPVVTVAVNVTACPNVDGFGEEPVIVLVVAALFTVCRTDPELMANFVEPL
jgi:predicted small secreted protein